MISLTAPHPPLTPQTHTEKNLSHQLLSLNCHQPGTDTGRDLRRADHLECLRLISLTEPPNTTEVIWPHSDTTCKTHKQTSLKTPPCSWSHLQIFPTVALTFAEQRGGADLSDGASEREAERFAAGIHTERTASVVLQLHLVKVCRYCVKGKKHFIQWWLQPWLCEILALT